MNVSNVVNITLLLIFSGILIVGIFYGIYWLSASSLVEDSVTDTRAEAQFGQYAQSARTYQARLLDYEGLCSAIGLPSSVACLATAEAYVMESQISNSEFYCIDSTGFEGRTTQSRGNRMSCAR